MLNVPESAAVAAADVPLFATQPVTCKARGCHAAAIERRLCAEHLAAVREREAERQRASKTGRDLRLALKGPPPVALLSRTYQPESDGGVRRAHELAARLHHDPGTRQGRGGQHAKPAKHQESSDGSGQDRGQVAGAAPELRHGHEPRTRMAPGTRISRRTRTEALLQ